MLVDGDPGQRVVDCSGPCRSATDGPVRAEPSDLWQNASQPASTPSRTRHSRRRTCAGGSSPATTGGSMFRTIRPVPYPIPDDGPVGRMLAADRPGIPGARPTSTSSSRAPGHRPFTTHVFDAASDYLDSDAVFGERDSLVDVVRGRARDLRLRVRARSCRRAARGRGARGPWSARATPRPRSARRGRCRSRRPRCAGGRSGPRWRCCPWRAARTGSRRGRRRTRRRSSRRARGRRITFA